MKKIFLTFILVSTIILFSCDNGKMNNGKNGENGKETYYTVTYHKNGKYFNSTNKEVEIKEEDITGEPPIDNNKYKPSGINEWTFSPIYGDPVVTLDRGTMEIEGYRFDYWEISGDYSLHAPHESYFALPGDKIYLYGNVDFYPVWREIY